MKCSKYFGAKRHGFIKSESILAPKGASHFKNENIKCDKSKKGLKWISCVLQQPQKVLKYWDRNNITQKWAQ
jgi:hypothetical protein